jgi:ABC-type sulfate transport system substrate-binding protein
MYSRNLFLQSVHNCSQNTYNLEKEVTGNSLAIVESYEDMLNYDIVSNLKEYADVFDLDIDLVSIQDFGGWDAAQEKHFSDGGIFDQIYEK